MHTTAVISASKAEALKNPTQPEVYLCIITTYMLISLYLLLVLVGNLSSYHSIPAGILPGSIAYYVLSIILMNFITDVISSSIRHCVEVAL